MAIKKQEFYEGAALHLLARSGRITALRYEPPLFVVNNRLRVLLKYSARPRSPWGFTFTPDEQLLLERNAPRLDTVIGLVCGSDGVATVTYEAYKAIAAPRPAALHLACYRSHGAHYLVSGPDGTLPRKVAPSTWQRILGGPEDDEAS
jgi:hypothetical protein